MDENYLDSLLNEVSLDKEIDHRIEEELDNQIQNEKRQYQQQQTLSDEDLFNMDLEQDANSMQSEQEFHFSQEQMDELDRLDNLADLDIGDLDFSDIDFDDLDITKLSDVDATDLDDLLKEFDGDLEIDNFFATSEKQDEETESMQSLVQENREEVLNDNIAFDNEPEEAEIEQKADLNEDSFDADQFLDSLLEETEPAKVMPEDILAEESQEMDFSQAANITSAAYTEQSDGNVSLEDLLEQNSSSEEEDDNFDLMAALEEFDEQNSGGHKTETNQLTSGGDEDQLDDLFSLLDLEELSDGFGSETGGSADSLHTDSETELNSSMELDDLEELPKEPLTWKQKLMKLIFGEPDEDDILTEEELAEIEKKKAAKKEKKEANKKAREEKAQTAKEEKALKNAEKQKEIEGKKAVKAKRKEYLKAQALAEKENEKKLNKSVVVFIFTLFLGGVSLFFVATDSFNYAQAIERAAKYFANQKYRKAYDEIVGVEVKEKDEDLKDRIYTVMYVERLYESYVNNIELGRQEKALDSLLRGVSKYYEHYEEAEELGVASDLDYSFSQIQTVLNEKYGITVEDAILINAMSDYEYVEYIETVINQQSDAEQSEETV